MALTKSKKKTILDQIKDIRNQAGSIVFVSFNKLTVAKADELRKGLRQDNSSYRVAKKTLVRLGLVGGEIAGEIPELPGEIALAYGADPVAPAKGIFNFSKTNPDLVKIVGGVFEGRFMSALEMNEVAKIPSQKVLYGQFVNLLNSPIQGLVMALDQIAIKKS